MIRVQLRYSFRLYPGAGQRTALARAFGCADGVPPGGVADQRTGLAGHAGYVDRLGHSRRLTGPLRAPRRRGDHREPGTGGRSA
ncbi:helix-turn-helix domain-containing protein [Streptomyces sp. NPDC086080]|uniref:helix-turn-helix domain-containing protein n=1 Tax=Streptomyces sp. NPDC086080 TaxID=3365748 RepID=UPI0037D41701